MRRVLVVDDDAQIRSLLCRQLHRLGYLAEAVGTVAEAAGLLTTWDPHVVILDLHLRGESGLAVIAAVRELAAPPRVVLCSGGPMEDVDGADAVLDKPFDFDLLAVMLEELLGRR